MLRHNFCKLVQLESMCRVRSASRSQQTVDHLCLFTRWYYRPQARRTGEAIFEETGEQSKKQLMRAISRVYRQAQAAHGSHPEHLSISETPSS